MFGEGRCRSMKEFIDKLISRLEEIPVENQCSKCPHKAKCDEIQENINNEFTDLCGATIKALALEIVNQLAEEYKSSISITDYDLIIKFIESEIERTSSFAEHDTQINIMNYVQQLQEQNNNGWIPCSERLPSKEEIEEWATFLVTIRVRGKYDIMDFCLFGTDGKWLVSEDREVIAWKRQTPYQPK